MTFGFLHKQVSVIYSLRNIKETESKPSQNCRRALLEGRENTGGDMLKINALTKRFGEKTAVDAATIHVEKPAMIGIIGRSGAGKSTLLRMVNCLSDATEGSITFEGKEIIGLKGLRAANGSRAVP